MQKPKVNILNTVDKLKHFFEVTAIHNHSPYVVIDTETNSVLEKAADLFGIGICFNSNEAFYIPIRDNSANLLWKEKTLNKLAGEIKKLCRERKLLGHNIIYDILVLKRNLKIDLTENVYADTILLKHCIDEEPPFGLKEVSVKYLGDWADKAQKDLIENIKKNNGKTTKENMEMWKADTEVLAEYCCWDTLLTYQLFSKFSLLLEEQGLKSLFFDEEIMPLYKECVIPMKDRGFPIDVEYFNNLKAQIETDIVKLEDEIQETIADYTAEFINEDFTKNFPIKRSGNFAKELASLMQVTASVTKAAFKKYVPETEQASLFKDWFLESISDQDLPQDLVAQAQYNLWKKRNPEDKYVFNLNSNKHLAWLFFEKLGVEPTEFTESGAPKLDAATLEGLSGQHPFCDKIIEYKKLQKLSGTYIDGILNREYQGVVYASFLMFGTTSGRFSSRDPNLQNLPRVKDEESNLSPLVLKYTNAIKKGFVAGGGYKIVNADYSQLEPCAFAAACGDEKLQAVFHNKWDLYCSIAIEATGLTEYSADKKAKNYLKNHRPELRQKFKAVALAVVYGAEANRISQVLGCTREEAQDIIDKYLEAYPGLVSYMKNCDKQVATEGVVKNRFGRIRHLTEAKQIAEQYGKKILDRRWAQQNDLTMTRWKFKNYLNNGKNFPIQSTAAHIVNRAMLAATREFKRRGIDGYISAQVHDEITCIVKEEQAELARKILKEAMENTTKIEVPLISEPMIADNWADAK